MEIPIHHIDAFVTDGVFTGNPAAVCPLAAWLPDAVMQKVAAENNLAETAFLVGAFRGGDLRCEDRGDRVAIGGRVAAYLEGVIRI